MKKAACICLSLIILLLSCTVAVSAENMPVFTVGVVEAYAGESVDVPVTLEANGGLISTILNIAFDTQVLTLTGVSEGGVFSGDYLFTNDLTVSPCKVIWYDALTHNNHDETGVLCVLHFTVSQNAQAGVYPITLSYEASSTMDTNLNNVACTVVDGSVTVPGWEFSEDCGLHVWTDDEETGNSYITGLDPDDPAVDGYIDMIGNWTYDVTLNDMDCEATGAVVTIYDEGGEAIERYETVYYGDITGDGQCNVDDVMEIIALVCRQNDSEWATCDVAAEYAQSMAADVNHDTMVDINDAMELISVCCREKIPNQQWLEDDDLGMLV